MTVIDILAFGAHPDDVELGVGGMLAISARAGNRVGVVDITRGELASSGTVEERDAEAAEAAGILGLAWRENLNLPDRGIEITRNTLDAVVNIIRKARPTVVLAPYYQDRHPDHVQTSKLIQQAWFDAGLKMLCPHLPPHRPKMLAYYCLNKYAEPNLVVDISCVYGIKMAAVNAHRSQFAHRQQGINTLVKNRDSFHGGIIGVEYGEGLVLNGPLAVNEILMLWSGGR